MKRLLTAPLRRMLAALVATLLLAAWTAAHAQKGTPPEYGPPVTILPDAGAPPKDPPADKKDDGKKDGKKKDEPKSPWAKIPPVRVYAPAGESPQLPTGPGYYFLSDEIHGTCRKGPPKYGYPRLFAAPVPFYDADWRYLEDPKNKDHDLFDGLHRCHLGCDWLFNTGGEFRWRHMHEINARLSGRNNDYDLVRTRVYGDLWYHDDFRVYVELIDAHSFNQDLAPLGIDVNGTDLLNAFVDLKIFEFDCQPVYLRIGRQELLLGSQRLISTIDWRNTRQTFQGVRAFRASEKLDFDVFWVQPVIPDPSNFDSVDNNKNFAGAWTTYRPKKGHFIDAYYLFFDDTNSATVRGIQQAPVNFHTLGARYLGDYEKRWLWDVELMLQIGERGDQCMIAGASSVCGGYHFKGLPMNPTFWVGWEFASGDQNPGVGPNYTTFNQLFNFGHYYFGYLDLIGRQNIHDVNCQLYLYPTNWITFLMQFHHFELAAARDALYGVAGAPLRRDPTGRAGTNVGNEIDLYLNFCVDKHSNVLVGYSKLFAGRFIEQTGPGQSPELFYLSYVFRW